MSLEGKDIVLAAKKQPVAFGCLFLVLVLALLSYFRMDALTTVGAALDEKSKLALKLKANLASSAQLDAQLKVLSQANEILKGSALKAGELAKNQQLFYKLESETVVRLIDLRQLAPTTLPKAGSTVNTYEPINFSLTIEGEFPQALLFIKGLEKGGLIAKDVTVVKVPPVSRILSATASVGATDVLNISLTVEILSLKQ